MTTITTVLNAHRGAVLPVARFIVVAVPLVLGFLYWLLAVRSKSSGRGR